MDFETLKVNERDPDLNKVVKKIVIQHHDFIVYLDEELDTQWHVQDEVGDLVRFGKVLNAVASVELRSDFLRDDERTFTRIRLLAGEAIARAIDDRDEKAAMSAIQLAEAIIAKRSAELSRRWYYKAAQNLVVGLVLFAAVAWLSRDVIPWDALIGRAAFQFIFCAVAGAVGALVSITIRSHNIELDAMSGELAHRMESKARILTGMVAAVGFGLATKLGWISLFQGDPESISFLMLLGLVAGASERAVPNFLSRFDPASAQHQKPEGADRKAATRGKATP
jgi:hypothetical protein